MKWGCWTEARTFDVDRALLAACSDAITHNKKLPDHHGSSAKDPLARKARPYGFLPP